MFGDSHYELQRFYKKYYKIDFFLRWLDHISNEDGNIDNKKQWTQSITHKYRQNWVKNSATMADGKIPSTLRSVSKGRQDQTSP